MNKLEKRRFLFLCICIPIRFSLIFISKYLKNKKNYKNLFSIMTLIFSLGFLKIYFLGSPLADSQLSWAGVEKVWWNDLRIAHGLLYLLFSIFYFLDYENAWYFLLADVLIGLFSFLNHHFNS